MVRWRDSMAKAAAEPALCRLFHLDLTFCAVCSLRLTMWPGRQDSQYLQEALLRAPNTLQHCEGVWHPIVIQLNQGLEQLLARR